MESAEIRKSLLVIKSSARSLGPAEAFLRNRDWKIHSTTNLKEALQILISRKPCFVMVCVDHPDKKVRALPRLLLQAFPAFVIAFVEKTGSASFNALKECGAPYRVNPPVTGPSVERTIHKIIRDLQVSEDRSNAAAKNEKTARMAQDFKNDIDAIRRGRSQPGSTTDQTSGLISVGGGGSSSSSMGSMGSGADSRSSSSRASMAPDPDELALSSLMQDVMMEVGDGTGGSFGGEDLAGDAPAFGAIPDEDLEPENEPEWNFEDEAFAAGSSDDIVNAESLLSGDPPAEGLLQVGSLETGKSATLTSGQAWLAEESLIEQGIRIALDESVNPGDGDSPEKLEMSKHLTCVIVRSDRFSGYLVAATGKDRLVDPGLFERIHARFADFLRKNGEPLREEKSMKLKVQAVEFEAWALQAAAILGRAVHNRAELGLAFFRRKDTDVLMEASPQSDMGTLSLADFRADSVVSFNVYLYLTANRRYVLYTPRGGVFYGLQKDRLVRLGFTHVHVKRADLREMVKDRARNFLEEKIEDFVTAKKRNSAA